VALSWRYPGFTGAAQYTFGLGRKWGIRSVPIRKVNGRLKRSSTRRSWWCPWKRRRTGKPGLWTVWF